MTDWALIETALDMASSLIQVQIRPTWDQARALTAIAQAKEALYRLYLREDKGPICAGCGKGVDRHYVDNGGCIDVEYSGGQRWDFTFPGETADWSWKKFEEHWKALLAEHNA
jgi:hypothetical protein